MIEASVVEVQLNDYNQKGVDWSRVTGSDGDGGTNARFGDTTDFAQTTSAFTASTLAPNFSLAHQFFKGSKAGTMTVALEFLEEFGDVSVLSSPKVMAINNQTAMMKVVDERVYFKLEVTQGTTSTDANGNTVTTASNVTGTKQTSLEGIILAVTPHVNPDGIITLHVRPTISQFLEWVDDPTTSNGVTTGNKVPKFQVREMDSMLRVPSGQVVVLGGMMRDKSSTKITKVPGLSNIPLLGEAFQKTQREVNKTELAIFLRPTIMNPDNMREAVQKTRFSFGQKSERFKNTKPDIMEKIRKRQIDMRKRSRTGYRGSSVRKNSG